jgi:hypothetical protein
MQILFYLQHNYFIAFAIATAIAIAFCLCKVFLQFCGGKLGAENFRWPLHMRWVRVKTSTLAR